MNLNDSLYDLASAEEAERQSFVHPDTVIRVWRGGGKLTLWSPAGDAWEVKFSEADLEHGTLSMTLPGTQVWDEFFEKLPEYEARLVSVDLPGGVRFAFIIRSADQAPDGDGHVWHINAASVSRYLDSVHLWSDPLMPPEVQISGAYRAIGPAATVWKTALMLNLVRLQSESWSIPATNPFDPGTWNLMAKALDPIIINPRRTGLLDTSGWCMAEWCMDSAWSAGVELCKTKDMSIRVDLWLPGDEQPFPEWLTLTEPKLIVDMVPAPREVTFTGTLLDGLIRDTVHLAEDAFDWISYPVLSPDGGPMDWLESRQGMHIPIYRAGEWSPLGDATKTISYPSATRATVGGKAPEWLNSIIADVVGVAVGSIGTAIGVPGLTSSFLEKFLQNRLFTWHSVEDLRIAGEAGRWRLRETSAGSQTTALSLQSAEAAKSTLWSNRGHTSRKVTVLNGEPYSLGRHLRVGWPVAVEHEGGAVDVEVLSGVEVEVGRAGTSVALTLSTPEPDEPGVFALQKLREAVTWIDRLAVAP